MTALVIGATGLVGSSLVTQLLEDSRFDKIKIFVRRATGLQHHKLEEHVIQFYAPNQWSPLVSGDVLFSALGTTLKKAGTKYAQYRVDYTYQYMFAKAAAKNSVPVYVLVSSAGASSNSRIFYSRIKGRLEDAIKTFSFSHIHILQPGLLKGPRQEFRLGEVLGIGALSFLQFVPGLGRFKPVPATIVAKAMIKAAFDTTAKIKTYALKKVFERAKV